MLFIGAGLGLAEGRTPAESLVPDTVVCVPLVFQSHRPLTRAPYLFEIENLGGLAGYVVHWLPLDGVTEYILEERSDGSFAEARTVYAGEETSVSVTAPDLGTFCYRVRGESEAASSPWSRTVSTVVSTTATTTIPQSGIWHGHWGENRVQFTVSEDGSEVTDGLIVIPCGSQTLPNTVPIRDNRFALTHYTGMSYVRMAFTAEDRAEGSCGVRVDGSCAASFQCVCQPDPR